MEKNIILAFCAGWVASMGVSSIFDVVYCRIVRKKGERALKQAYETLKKELTNDLEFAEYLKKTEPETYKKIMES